MSRAVLLPTPGSNPFLIRAALRNFDSWRRPDDRVYVCVTWPQPLAVEKAIEDMVLARHGYVIHQLGERIDHGMALDLLVPMVREEVVLFMEDDLYVREPAHLEQLTREVELGGYDVVGAPRMNGSKELYGHMLEQKRAALWPHLLIARRDALQAVTESWVARIWEAGEFVKGLNFHTRDRLYSDTAVAATLELREGRSVYQIDTENVEVANEYSSWFHVGSLSTGPLRTTPDGASPEEGAAEQPHSWSQRVAWWERVLRPGTLGLEDLHRAHTEAVARLAGICGHSLVQRWRNQYDRLVNWEEA